MVLRQLVIIQLPEAPFKGFKHPQHKPHGGHNQPGYQPRQKRNRIKPQQGSRQRTNYTQCTCEHYCP